MRAVRPVKDRDVGAITVATFGPKGFNIAVTKAVTLAEHPINLEATTLTQKFQWPRKLPASLNDVAQDLPVADIEPYLVRCHECEAASEL